MNMKKLIRRTLVYFNHVSRNNIPSYAAAAAYYFFMSLIPILIILMAIIPYTPLTQDNVVTWIVDLFPATLSDFVISIIRGLYGKTVAVISISAITTFWAASRAVFALIRGLNSVYEIRETRNMYLMRLRCGIYTLTFLIMFVVLLIINVFGDRLIDILFSEAVMIIDVWQVVKYLRYVVVILVLMILFMILFTKLPNRKMQLWFQWPGALTAAVSWTIFTWFFNMYIEYFNAFSMYGSLTTIIILMLWLDTLMYLLLMGAQLNYFFEPVFIRQKEKREIESKIKNMRRTVELSERRKKKERNENK